MSGGGSGGTTTTTVDPIYNAGRLALAEGQQEWAGEMINMFKYGVMYDPSERVRGAYVDGNWVDDADLTGETMLNPHYSEGYWQSDPYRCGAPDTWVPGRGEEYIDVPSSIPRETVTRGELEGYDPSAQSSEMQYLQNTVEANQSLLAGQTALAFEQLGLERGQTAAAESLLPGQTALSLAQMGLTQAQIDARMGLLPGETALSALQTSDTMTGIQERAPVRSRFFSEALEGVDATERMGSAQADVAQGFASAEGTARRNIARSGLSAANIDFGQMATEKAKGIGLARTTARTSAKDESFRRLQIAAGA